MATKVTSKESSSMNSQSQSQNKPSQGDKSEMGTFFGQMYAFNNSLKLYHWHVSGKGSYAQHMALDQALETLVPVLDRIVETAYAMEGDIQITIPETSVPGNIVQHCSDFFDCVEYNRELFDEDFQDSILDDYHEAIQQLLYRLKRLQ